MLTYVGQSSCEKFPTFTHARLRMKTLGLFQPQTFGRCLLLNRSFVYIYIYRCQMWGCLKNLWMKSTIFPQDGQSWLICTDVRMALAVACAVLARCGGRTGGSQSHFWPIRDSVSAHRNKLTDSNGNFLYLGMVEFAASLFTKKIPKGTIE